MHNPSADPSAGDRPLPPRPDRDGALDSPDRAGRRGVRVALVVLGLASVIQTGIVAFGWLAFAFGQVTAIQFLVYVAVTGAGLVVLGLTLIRVSGRRWRPPTGLVILPIAIADVAVFALIGGGALGGSCTERELAVTRELAPFPGSEIEYAHESESDACTAAIDVRATSDEIVEHFRAELGSDGWTVTGEDRQSGTAEGGEAVVAAELTAERRGATFSLSLESFDGMTAGAVRIDA